MNSRMAEASNIDASFLTAQDRKKKILERRRQSLQRSQSMPTNISATFLSKRQRLETFSRASFSPSIKSQLFPDNSRLEVEEASVKTRLFNDDSNSENVVPPSKNDVGDMDTRGPRHSSLFGLVMKQTQNWSPKLDRYQLHDPPMTPTQRVDRQFTSPGGVRLLKMLSSVTSPFVGENSRESPVKTDQRDVWEEASLDQILDWTMKSKVRLECYPSSCLPSSIAEGLDNWKRALQYWQYPSDITDRISENKDLVSLSSEALKYSETPEISSSHLAQSLVDAVKGPNAHVSQLVDTTENFLPFRKRRRWQDAYQSLFFQWLDKIESGHRNAYFFATSTNHHDMYRPSVVEDKLLPMIIFSSTSKEFRALLLARGVKLYVLGGSSDLEAFKESNQDETHQDCISDGEKQDDLLVDIDLEALRKAQAYGQTAGADVIVKAPSRRPAQSGQVPALYVVGYDDCSAVGTVMLNQPHNVEPILMTRMGPFQHSTLNSLVVAKRRIDHNSAFVELVGPILPCTLPSLAKATAAVMRHRAGEDTSKRVKGDHPGLETHNFVLHATDLDSKACPRVVKIVLNGSKSCVHHVNDVCTNLERVNVMVWDISRPTVVTFKREIE